MTLSIVQSTLSAAEDHDHDLGVTLDNVESFYGEDLAMDTESMDMVLMDQVELSNNDTVLEIFDACLSATEAQQTNVENSIEFGGLDKHGATVMLSAMNSTMGLISETFELPDVGIESFDEADQRIASTQLGLEGIKDRAESILKSIMSVIQAGIAIVKKFMARNFTEIGRLKSAAVKLMASAKAAKGTGSGKVKLSASVANWLSTDGKTVSVSGFAATNKLLMQIAKSNDVDTMVERYGKAMGDVKAKTEAEANASVGTLNSARSGVQAALTKSLGATEAVSDDAKKTIKSPDAYASIKQSTPIFGGARFVIGIPKEGSERAVSTTYFDRPDKAMKSDDYTALSTSAVQSLCKDIIKMAQNAEALRKKSDDATSAQEKLIEGAKKMSTELKGSDVKGDSMDSLKSMMKDARAMAKAAREPKLQMAKIVIKVAKAGLNYGIASIKGMKKGDKKDDKNEDKKDDDK